MEQPIKEVIITRMINAPRELVFRVWTDAEHLGKWWGPRGFTSPVCEIDPRPGGSMRIMMDHPAFPEHWMDGVFHQVIEPELLEFRSRAFIGADGQAGLEIMNAITFEEAGAQTRLTVKATVLKANEELSFALNGMDQGWRESLDKMGEYIAETF